jgi:uncharacterized membrane protein YbaN (DUF454 family)
VNAVNPVTRPAISAGRARLWRILGGICIAIGTFNAFVPLLPTTVFWIVGVWAYSKGAPHLAEKLLAHPRFGPGLRLWMEHRMMTRTAKIQALGAISLGYAASLLWLGPNPVTLTVGIGLVGLMAYLGSRPEPPPGR